MNEPAGKPPPELTLTASPGFVEWLAREDVSLAFTTYQSGKLFLIGRHEDDRLAVFERTYSRCMGMYATAQTLYVSTLYQLWRFENALAADERHDGHDRLYMPQLAWTTGDLDIHDIVVEDGGRIVFANTAFSCLATVSETHSFVPLWKPPFVSGLAGEDRCHLNGIALRDGRARYVTTVGRTDEKSGWRSHRHDGGAVIDLAGGDVVAEGLSMPHSPRWFMDRLWLHQSGTGQFGYIDFKAGRFVPVAFCPGYLRGLGFVRDFAVTGLSRPRVNKTFSALQLDAELRRRGTEAICGLHIINVRSGQIEHWVRIEGIVEELYDVAVLPGVRRPMALGFKTDEIQHVVTIGSG